MKRQNHAVAFRKQLHHLFYGFQPDFVLQSVFRVCVGNVWIGLFQFHEPDFSLPVTVDGTVDGDTFQHFFHTSGLLLQQFRLVQYFQKTLLHNFLRFLLVSQDSETTVVHAFVKHHVEFQLSPAFSLAALVYYDFVTVHRSFFCLYDAGRCFLLHVNLKK